MMDHAIDLCSNLDQVLWVFEVEITRGSVWALLFLFVCLLVLWRMKKPKR
jgi:hypothetical protein